MGLAQDFANLGEEMLGSFDRRIQFLGENIVHVRRLATETHKLQRRFRKEQGAIGRECLGAHQAWKKASRAMAAKRRNFNGRLNRAKQKIA